MMRTIRVEVDTERLGSKMSARSDDDDARDTGFFPAPRSALKEGRGHCEERKDGPWLGGRQGELRGCGDASVSCGLDAGHGCGRQTK